MREACKYKDAVRGREQERETEREREREGETNPSMTDDQGRVITDLRVTRQIDDGVH